MIIILIRSLKLVGFYILSLQEASGYQRKAIFSLEAPSPAICLLVQLEKHVTEEGGVTPSVYTRKEPVSLLCGV